MPEEVLVSSSLTVGKTMPGTLKHFANGKEQRTPAPVTLLSASTLRIGDGDIRQIVASSTQDVSSIIWSPPEAQMLRSAYRSKRHSPERLNCWPRSFM